MSKIMGSKNQVYQGKINASDFYICASTVVDAPPETPNNFVDWLRSGWEISQVVAIDYTASNGNPLQPQSLHFMGPNN